MIRTTKIKKILDHVSILTVILTRWFLFSIFYYFSASCSRVSVGNDQDFGDVEIGSFHLRVLETKRRKTVQIVDVGHSLIELRDMDFLILYCFVLMDDDEFFFFKFFSLFFQRYVR